MSDESGGGGVVPAVGPLRDVAAKEFRVRRNLDPVVVDPLLLNVPDGLAVVLERTKVDQVRCGRVGGVGLADPVDHHAVRNVKMRGLLDQVVGYQDLDQGAVVVGPDLDPPVVGFLVRENALAHAVLGDFRHGNHIPHTLVVATEIIESSGSFGINFENNRATGNTIVCDRNTFGTPFGFQAYREWVVRSCGSIKVEGESVTSGNSQGRIFRPV